MPSSQLSKSVDDCFAMKAETMVKESGAVFVGVKCGHGVGGIA